MTLRALVIDDDPAIVEEVSEILASLGHECATAGCMTSADALIKQDRFDYVVLDLEIPVGAGSKFPRVDNGKNMLRKIRNLPGMRQIPIIIMTGHGNDGPYQAVEVLRLGAVHYLAKPFGRNGGPTLDDAIREVVPDHGYGENQAHDEDGTLKPFVGGELAYSAASVTLEGVTIAGRRGGSLARKILDHLNQPGRSGARRKWQAFGGAAIAESIGATDQNAVASAVKKLRAKITKVLGKELGLEVDGQAVIENKDQAGYRFTDHLTVAGSSAIAHDPANEPANDPASNAGDPANGCIDDTTDGRRAWVIMELKSGRELRRGDLMTRFEVSESTAKRDLRALIEGGQVAFVGPTKTGHYELKDGRS